MSRVYGFVPGLFLTISLLGLVLIVFLVNAHPTGQWNLPYRKPLIGAIFGIICVLGFFAGIFPSRCSKIVHFKPARQDESDPKAIQSADNSGGLKFRGHHPDCQSFGAHVLHVGQKCFCAGCVGLVAGACLSLIGVAYWLLGVQAGSIDASLTFWVGFAGVCCGLLQYHIFNLGRSTIHLLVNTYFVVGVFWVLVGVDGLLENTVVDLYVVALSLFWLYTRILLSQYDHKRICVACTTQSCELVA